LTYQSIYLINYYKKGFLCGKTPNKVVEDGYLHYFENVPKEELKMLLEINDAGHKLYEGLPKEKN